MNVIPSSVAAYLQSIGNAIGNPAFLHLDSSNQLVDWSIQLNDHGLKLFDAKMLTVKQLTFLEGLLPCPTDPLIIPRMQLAPSQYCDLHMFSDNQGQWIILIDSTNASIRAQSRQQYRLSNELLFGG